MQFLIFHLGKDRYGLQTRHIVRILPLLELKTIPRSPDYVAGLINFHGLPVPVIDLSMLARGAASNACFDTRIILVDYCTSQGTQYLLGLIAERVSNIADFDPADFSESGVSNENAHYLGQVTSADGTIVQLVELAQLLPDAVRATLYPQPAGTDGEARC